MSTVATLIASAKFESHHWLWPELKEIIYGGIASVLVIGSLVKFAGPLAKKALAARTERIQAEQLVREGRARIEAEMADMEAKAMADIAKAGARVSDELKAEISRLSSVAVERVVAQAMDDKARQDLIENFISNVGASR